jgi:hypothetical protein
MSTAFTPTCPAECYYSPLALESDSPSWSISLSATSLTAAEIGRYATRGLVRGPPLTINWPQAAATVFRTCRAAGDWKSRPETTPAKDVMPPY